MDRDLVVVSHDVAETCKESGACCNLRMHRTVDVIQQVQRLTNQLIAIVKQALLDLGLTAREHVVSVTRLKRSRQATVFTRHTHTHTRLTALFPGLPG